MQVERIFLLGKGKRTPNQSANALTQGVVQALYMSRKTTLLIHYLVRSLGQTMVGLLAIAVIITAQILIRNFAP